jgi:hypothetical protein
MWIRPGSSHRELVHVRCANDYGTCIAQPLYDDRVARCSRLGRTYRRAGEGYHTGDIAQILYADRYTLERSARLGALATRVRFIGGSTRLVSEHADEGSRSFTVRLGDSSERLFNELAAGDAARGEVAIEISKCRLAHRGDNLPLCGYRAIVRALSASR